MALQSENSASAPARTATHHANNSLPWSTASNRETRADSRSGGNQTITLRRIQSQFTLITFKLGIKEVTAVIRTIGSIVFPVFLFATLSASTENWSVPPAHPMRFFEGRTVSEGTLKVIMKKPVRTRSINRGRIERDGTLFLVQTVQDEGQEPRERRWRIKATGQRTFTATMSEATGPVAVEEVNGRFRFRFKMEGNLSVEQWLAPLADGKSARSNIIVRKFGMTVATSEALVRKVN